MNIKTLIFKHKLAIGLLRLIEKKQKQKSDVALRIQLEDAKEYTEQYLLTPKKWYEQMLKDATIDLNWAEKRYEQMIKNFDENLLREKLNDISNE